MKRVASHAWRRAIVLSTVTLCLLAVEWAVGWSQETLNQYDGRFEPGGFARRQSEIETLEGCDIILLGSSRVMYALVPEEFRNVTHHAAYNLGLSGGRTADWQIFARRLSDHHRPELIILGVNAEAFFQDYIPERTAFLLFDFDDLLESFRREGFSRKVISRYAQSRFTRLWTLYGRRAEIKHHLQEQTAWLFPKYAQLSREQRRRSSFLSPHDGYENLYIALGHETQTLQEAIDGGTPIHFPLEDIPQFVPDASPYGRFGDVLAFFNDRHISVIVAYLPNSPRAEARWKAEEPSIIHHIAGLCQTHDVPFINCRSEQIRRTNGDYLDEIHVDLPLARRISRHIARRIVAMNLLPQDTPQFVQSQTAAMQAP